MPKVHTIRIRVIKKPRAEIAPGPHRSRKCGGNSAALQIRGGSIS